MGKPEQHFLHNPPNRDVTVHANYGDLLRGRQRGTLLVLSQRFGAGYPLGVGLGFARIYRRHNLSLLSFQLVEHPNK